MKLTQAEFLKLVKSHETGADHAKLAAHFTAHADEHENDARIHEEVAVQYEKTHPQLAGEARHYAAHSREAAEAMRNLARIHQELGAKHHQHVHA